MLFAFNTLILCKDTGRVSGGRREEGGMERCNAGIEACLHTWRKSKKGCRHVSTAELCINKAKHSYSQHQQNTLWDILILHQQNIYTVRYLDLTPTKYTMRYLVLHQQNTLYDVSWSYTMHCIDSHAYSNTCESSKTSGCRRWRRKREFWNTCLWLRFLNSEVLRCALPLSNQPSSGSCLYGYMCTWIYVCMQTRVQK